MSSGHKNQNNPPRLSKLEWAAFCYVADELKDHHRKAFEMRLAIDHRAREAVTNAVENFELISAALQSRNILATDPVTTRKASETRNQQAFSDPQGRSSSSRSNSGRLIAVSSRVFSQTNSRPHQTIDSNGLKSLNQPWNRRLPIEKVLVGTTAILVLLLGNLIWNPHFQPEPSVASLPASVEVAMKNGPIDSGSADSHERSDLPIRETVDLSTSEIRPNEISNSKVEPINLENQPPSMEQRALTLFQFWTTEPRSADESMEDPVDESGDWLLTMGEDQLPPGDSIQVILDDGNWMFEALWEKAKKTKPSPQPQSDSPPHYENKPSEFLG